MVHVSIYIYIYHTWILFIGFQPYKPQLLEGKITTTRLSRDDCSSSGDWVGDSRTLVWAKWRPRDAHGPILTHRGADPGVSSNVAALKIPYEQNMNTYWKNHRNIGKKRFSSLGKSSNL